MEHTNRTTSIKINGDSFSGPQHVYNTYRSCYEPGQAGNARPNLKKPIYSNPYFVDQAVSPPFPLGFASIIDESARIPSCAILRDATLFIVLAKRSSHESAMQFSTQFHSLDANRREQSYW